MTPLCNRGDTPTGSGVRGVHCGGVVPWQGERQRASTERRHRDPADGADHVPRPREASA
jgi:hypothetical protein